MSIEFPPLRPGTLQRQPGQAPELVACVFDDIGQRLAQLGRLWREHQPELGQQAADAVDAGRALLLEALAACKRHSFGIANAALTAVRLGRIVS